MFLEKFTNARFDCTIYHAFNRILKQYAEVPQWVFCKYLSLISRVSYKAGLFLSPFSSALCRWISLSSVIIFTKVGILLDDTIFCTPWNRLSIRRKLWRGLQSLVINLWKFQHFCMRQFWIKEIYHHWKLKNAKLVLFVLY